jgi:hypothetical protein
MPVALARQRIVAKREHVAPAAALRFAPAPGNWLMDSDGA